MARKKISNTDDRRVWNVYYTGYGTKLFVENGVLVEQNMKSVVPSPNAGFKGMPLNNPLYSSKPPEKRPEPTAQEIADNLIRQSTITANEALAYYNSKHRTKYELVDPIHSKNFMRNGFWFHCNFTAKPVNGHGVSSKKLFFAELKADGVKFGTPQYLVTTCRPLDGAKTTTGCEICDGMSHPTSGFLHGNGQFKPRVLRPRREGKVVLT